MSTNSCSEGPGQACPQASCPTPPYTYYPLPLPTLLMPCWALHSAGSNSSCVTQWIEGLQQTVLRAPECPLGWGGGGWGVDCTGEGRGSCPHSTQHGGRELPEGGDHTQHIIPLQ